MRRRSLPDLEELGLSSAGANGKPVLGCFFDMQQRSSRNCVLQLSRRMEQLKQEELVVVAVQASKMEEMTLKTWVKESEILLPVGMIRQETRRMQQMWGVKVCRGWS